MTKYEIFYVDTGKTVYLTYKQCCDQFGEEEFKEILCGYAPHIVAVEVNMTDLDSTS